MQEYFSKANRENHMIMLLVWEKIDMWVSQTKQLSKSELKALRAARTLILNANSSIILRLGKEYHSKLVRDIQNSKFEILTNYIASGKKASVKVITDDIEILGRYATNACQSCNNNCDSYWQKCEVFEALYRMNIEPLHILTDSCPYKQDEREETL